MITDIPLDHLQSKTIKSCSQVVQLKIHVSVLGMKLNMECGAFNAEDRNRCSYSTATEWWSEPTVVDMVA